MRVLLLDLIHDLRVKRIWPVALVLMLAIVAVPLVLLGTGGTPVAEAPGPQPTPAAPAALPTEVKLSDAPEGGSSKLDEFDSQNPFKPGKLPETKAASAEAGGGSGSSAGGGSGEGSSAPAQAATAVTPIDNEKTSSPKAPKNPPAQTPSTPVGNDKGGKGSDKNGSKNKGKGNDNARTRLLAYEVDAAYGPGGKAKSHTLRQMDVFPARKKYFLFSGVNDGGREAVFTVLDDTLEAEKGEGHCKQVNGRCQVLYLRDGQERRFKDARGNSFVVRLGDVNLIEKAVTSITGKLADTVDKLVDPLK